MTLVLTSPAFLDAGSIPTVYTCDGQDLSPPLAWSGVPSGSQSLVLIIDDPDAPDPAAPRQTWVHWLLFNLPTSTHGLPEGIAADALPAGTRSGINDFQKTSYGGPCPPIGRHRYFHHLYALDTMLDLKTPTKPQLLQAMAGHILAQAELMGTYAKS